MKEKAQAILAILLVAIVVVGVFLFVRSISSDCGRDPSSGVTIDCSGPDIRDHPER